MSLVDFGEVRTHVDCQGQMIDADKLVDLTGDSVRHHQGVDYLVFWHELMFQLFLRHLERHVMMLGVEVVIKLVN